MSDERDYHDRQRQNAYNNAKAAYDAAYATWKRNGQKGPPPPRPVKPHTPGFPPAAPSQGAPGGNDG